MPRLVAFLRAVNVGGRVVRMDELRRLFGTLGFTGVETFIASGNVVFDTRASGGATVERTIEKALESALGYEVATFVRTPAELAAAASGARFAAAALAEAAALNVAFLAGAPDAAAARRILSLRTEVDDFLVSGREVYWLCRVKQSNSRFSNAVLERALGARATLRSMTTVRKLAERVAASADRRLTDTASAGARRARAPTARRR